MIGMQRATKFVAVQLSNNIKVNNAIHLVAYSKDFGESNFMISSKRLKFRKSCENNNHFCLYRRVW